MTVDVIPDEDRFRNGLYSEYLRMRKAGTSVAAAGRTYTEANAVKRPMRKLTGFTLTELLIPLTIPALLAAIAVPSFARLIRDTRLSTSANSVVSVL